MVWDRETTVNDTLSWNIILGNNWGEGRKKKKGRGGLTVTSTGLRAHLNPRWEQKAAEKDVTNGKGKKRSANPGDRPGSTVTLVYTLTR